jgi:hypothetical protein
VIVNEIRDELGRFRLAGIGRDNVVAGCFGVGVYDPYPYVGF